jgi:hypothetical protein
MYRYLVDTLGVPTSNIEMLLNAAATQDKVEEAFVRHLICNPAVQDGDAIIIYWAGHGSRIPAPMDWFGEDIHAARSHNVEVLCTYDYEKMRADGMGRIAGISDRSMQTMLDDLAAVKGDNITFIIDGCFSMPPTQDPRRDRKTTRCTPVVEASPDDLFHGLWPAARGKPKAGRRGFRKLSCGTILLASSKGERAAESKKGGNFTLALIQTLKDLSLHRTSYALLCDRVQLQLDRDRCNQTVNCRGDKDRWVLDAVPFEPDPDIYPLHVLDASNASIIVEAGAKAGLNDGMEMSVHLHRYGGSRNDIIGKLILEEVNLEHSRGRVVCDWNVKLPDGCCWAKPMRTIASKRQWGFNLFKRRTRYSVWRKITQRFGEI